MHPHRLFRWASAADADLLADIMFDAVRNGESRYSEAQRAAWVPAPRSGEDWVARLEGQDILVAEEGGEAIGFVSLAEGGYVDFAYIRPKAQHSGLFRQLLSRIVERAIAKGEQLLWTHASLMAEPAFAKLGFTVRKREQVRIGDQIFDRCEMEKSLSESDESIPRALAGTEAQSKSDDDRLQPTLEGNAVLLRPLRHDDYSGLYAVAGDPQLWALHPARDRWREPEFRNYFETWLLKGGGLTFLEKDSGRIIGASCYSLEGRLSGEVEIGWTFLARDHWGGATNREVKRLMIEHALRFFERVVFRVAESNLCSRRALEKIGARLTERSESIPVGGREVRHLLYEIEAPPSG